MFNLFKTKIKVPKRAPIIPDRFLTYTYGSKATAILHFDGVDYEYLSMPSWLSFLTPGRVEIRFEEAGVSTAIIWIKEIDSIHIEIDGQHLNDNVNQQLYRQFLLSVCVPLFAKIERFTEQKVLEEQKQNQVIQNMLEQKVQKIAIDFSQLTTKEQLSQYLISDSPRLRHAAVDRYKELFDK